eukprot:NODE_860_length_3458_cov_1.103007.p4 type:complete len:130 gc:universal NODE_860_length_3458_cov_1.103007:3117-2728(-)
MIDIILRTRACNPFLDWILKSIQATLNPRLFSMRDTTSQHENKYIFYCCSLTEFFLIAKNFMSSDAGVCNKEALSSFRNRESTETRIFFNSTKKLLFMLSANSLNCFRTSNRPFSELLPCDIATSILDV